MTPAALLAWMETEDVPGLVRALRADLGHASPEEAARALGWNPAGTWGGYVRDVEEGREPGEPWGRPYVVRGLVALWFLRCGGWRVDRASGAYVRDRDGARIDGGASGHWCSWPRGRTVHEPMRDGDIDGPVIRRGILRLMLRVEAMAGRVAA